MKFNASATDALLDCSVCVSVCASVKVPELQIYTETQAIVCLIKWENSVKLSGFNGGTAVRVCASVHYQPSSPICRFTVKKGAAEEVLKHPHICFQKYGIFPLEVLSGLPPEATVPYILLRPCLTDWPSSTLLIILLTAFTWQLVYLLCVGVCVGAHKLV